MLNDLVCFLQMIGTSHHNKSNITIHHNGADTLTIMFLHYDTPFSRHTMKDTESSIEIQ
jgi:hypothetical protein